MVRVVEDQNWWQCNRATLPLLLVVENAAVATARGGKLQPAAAGFCGEGRKRKPACCSWRVEDANAAACAARGG